MTKVRVHDTGSSNRLRSTHVISQRAISPRCIRPLTAGSSHTHPSRFSQRQSNQEDPNPSATLIADSQTAPVERVADDQTSKMMQPKNTAGHSPPTPRRPKTAPKPPTPREMPRRPHTSSTSAPSNNRRISTQEVQSPRHEAPTPKDGYAVEAVRQFIRAVEPDSSKRLRSAFLTWDTNRDGYVSEHDMRDMMTSMGWTSQLGQETTEKVIQTLVEPQSGLVSKDAFCGLDQVCPASNEVQVEIQPTSDSMDTKEVIRTLRQRYNNIPLAAVFRNWDDKKESKLNQVMLQFNLTKLSIPATESTIQELLHTYDRDNDGALCFAEFEALMDGPLVDAHDRTSVVERNHKLKPHVVHAPVPVVEASVAVDKREDEAVVEVAERVFEKLKSQKTRIVDIFKAMDEDASGVLSYAEFRQGLKHKGILLSEQEFHRLMTDVDRDQNGLVTFPELSSHLTACEKMVTENLTKIPAITRHSLLFCRL
ncbi:hypothetical protein AeRB84_019838 [Aphanomyces euteiches]|nr:hypothetical protein AeRB84_019838 [Aphanomyces euteiches]